MTLSGPGISDCQRPARKIWLTRHGESQYNVLGLLGGDSGLSPRGQAYQQALPHLLESRLSQVACPGSSIVVWTSTLQRTIQTAHGLNLQQCRRKELDEINAGICDGLTYADVADQHPAEHAARKRDKLRYRYPSGESYLDVMQRLEPVVQDLLSAMGHVVVVSHQAVLRAIYGILMQLDPEQVPTLEMPLHTLIELTPVADGSFHEVRFPVSLNTSLQMTGASVQNAAPHGHSSLHTEAAAAAACAEHASEDAACVSEPASDEEVGTVDGSVANSFGCAASLSGMDDAEEKQRSSTETGQEHSSMSPGGGLHVDQRLLHCSLDSGAGLRLEEVASVEEGSKHSCMADGHSTLQQVVLTAVAVGE